MKVKSESEVAQSCPTLSDPMDCSLPGSSVHGVFQARVLEWGVLQDLIGSVSLPGSNCIVPLNLHSQGKKQKRIQVKRAHQPACLIPNLIKEKLLSGHHETRK